MKEYKVIEGIDIEENTITDFEEKVTKYLNEGWYLVGGIEVKWSKDLAYYYQAIVRVTENAKPN